MSWIILALTLGASITSIIHGVFMLFGSLSVNEAALFGIPSTLLASLPVISAIFALIGGIMAFNQHKWGALFLFVAMGLCVPSRDTWLYGGLYFFAGLFCFFLKPKSNQDYYDEYDDENLSSEVPPEDDFYYEPVIPQPILKNDTQEDALPPENREPQDPLSDDVSANEAAQLNAEITKIRAHRMTKSCPECGAIVSRESRFCPTCGAKLSVILNHDGNFRLSGNESDIDLARLNEQLLPPLEGDIPIENGNSDNDIQEQPPADNGALNIETDDGDDMVNARADNYRVLVKPGRAMERTSGGNRRTPSANDVASGYQDFSKVTRKGKKRSRSFGRKAISMLVLVSAVGGALYFLLGLRKLPPGDLPPIAKTEIITENETTLPPVTTPDPVADERTKPAETPSTATAIAVTENVLPNFTPERQPRNGVITGSSVNVRADHNTSSARVTRLNVNSKVEILGTFNVTSGKFSGIWYNIRTGNNEGWVYGKYLRPVGSGLPSGYSNALLKSFGSTKSQLVDTFGNPTRSTSSSAEWPGLTATLKGNEITRIRITSNSHELQNGLKPGMSETALLQIMGYPSSQNGRNMNYNEGGKTGLTVQLDRNNSITSITVNEI